jgi:hypothetical protein
MGDVFCLLCVPAPLRDNSSLTYRNNIFYIYIAVGDEGKPLLIREEEKDSSRAEAQGRGGKRGKPVNETENPRVDPGR